MADLIQGTITETDPAIAAEIAERIVLNNISGNDFLDLSEKCLREWDHFTAHEVYNSFILMQAVVERERPGL